MILPKNHLFLLIISLYLLTPSKTQMFDICSGKVEPSAIPNLVIGVPLSITQTTCRYRFKFDYTSIAEPYMIFEVKFSNLDENPTFRPYLLEKNDPSSEGISVYTRNAVFTSNTALFSNANADDQNAYINQKDYHYVILEKSKLDENTELYFAIYNVNLDTNANGGLSVKYTVTLRTSRNYPCPQQCMNANQGECSNSLKRCICKEGYFDSDCSVQARKLNPLVASQATLRAGEWVYFYFHVNLVSHDLLLTFMKERKETVSYSFFFNQPYNYKIPNDQDSDGKFALYNDEVKGNLEVQNSDLKEYKEGVLVLGAYNDGKTSVLTSITFEDNKSSSLIRNLAVYTALAFSLLVLIIWAIIGVLKRKYHTQILSALQAFRVTREEEKTLTKKDMNIYFPKKKFGDITSSFSQTLCSVCLEDFEPDANCRQLYCEHIYHSNCIEAWLSNHYNCPNCKKEMNKLSIEEFFKNKNKKDEKKSLLPKSSQARLENAEREQIQEREREEEEEKSPEFIGLVETPLKIVKVDVETLQIKQSVRDVDEPVFNRPISAVSQRPISAMSATTENKSYIKFEFDNFAKSKNTIVAEVEMQVESPSLNDSKRMEDSQEKPLARLGTGVSHFHGHTPSEIPSFLMGHQDLMGPQDLMRHQDLMGHQDLPTLLMGHLDSKPSAHMTPR